VTGVTSAGDESRTESAWREIVENYGERPDVPAAEPPAPLPEPAAYGPDDEPEEPVDEIAEVDRFQPPVAPPIPLPRNWQRGVAWGGIFVAPALALLIAVFSLRPPQVFGWALVLWLVGGFLYLIFDMPREPRDPWDNGSRI